MPTCDAAAASSQTVTGVSVPPVRAHELEGPANSERPVAGKADGSDGGTVAELAWKKIRAAKRAVRSELSVSQGEWRRRGFARQDVCSTSGVVDTVARVHCSDLTPQSFAARFERPRLPAVITGLCDGWEAARGWTLDRLLQRLGRHKFKVGSDDDGYAVRLRFAHYVAYLQDVAAGAGADDSPLYIFDGTFADRAGSAGLARDYAPPPLFAEDLLQHAGERRRPPYRWFVMGPARSGSNLHVDPLATSAWNALLQGHKRWALFPPGTPRHLVQPREPGLEREAVAWFTTVYPRTQRPDWPAARPVDILQGPGETVFVPGGWWHVVMNLDTTIAVTHNYASSANFSRVWRHTKRGRRKMSGRWLTALRALRPDLAAEADELAARRDDLSATSSSSSSSSSSSTSGSSSDSSSSSGGDSAGIDATADGGGGDGRDSNKAAGEPCRNGDVVASCKSAGTGSLGGGGLSRKRQRDDDDVDGVRPCGHNT